jgi:hypothetical protein
MRHVFMTRLAVALTVGLLGAIVAFALVQR